MEEDILDRDLPIVDPHHHLWDFAPELGGEYRTHPFSAILGQTPRYMLDQLLADCRDSAHNVIATVFMQSGAFYRADGPEAMKPVGEIEFVNGIAAQTASGHYGPFRACAGIVGHADLTLGSSVAAVLEAEVRAGNGRFSGIRHIGAYDDDPSVLGPLSFTPPGLYSDSSFLAGFARLASLGLTFDAWVLEPQIHEVTRLARAFPEQAIVLDHLGTPLGLGRYAGRMAERFGPWRNAIRELATCANVTVKLGGLAMPFCAFEGLGPEVRPVSARMADLWRPYIETCIEAFGATRCMFESNFPVDRWGAGYRELWNAFKRIVSGASPEEKHHLFANTAVKTYRLTEICL